MTLGREIGRGAEGAVFDVAGRGDLVAKVYATTPDAEKAEKLRVMVRRWSPELEQVGAWPRARILEGLAGRPVGFLMSKLGDTLPLDSMIVPVQRHRDFPSAHWGHIVQTARNLADSVGDLHAAGIVVGDLNENNVRVTREGLVRFIDCDSFQIEDGGRRFPAPMGTLLYWPPELHGQAASTVLRVPNHDAFALAVLIFRLLFLGRHPYGGRFLGRGAPPTVERYIAEHRFAYGRHAAQFEVAPPPHAIQLSRLPTETGALFEAAFASDAGRSGTRPRAHAWVAPLERLHADLTPCSASRAHVYPRSARTCPWCEIEQSSGSVLFLGAPRATRANAAGAAAPGLRDVDVARLWAAINAIPAPRAAEALLPTPRVLETLEARLNTPSVSDRWWARGGTALSWATWVLVAGLIIAAASDRGGDNPLATFLLITALGLGVLGLLARLLAGLLNMRPRAVRTALKTAADSMRRGLDAARAELETYLTAENALRRQLEQDRDALRRLGSDYAEALATLQNTRRAEQLSAHLTKFRLRGARIDGIGAGLLQALESYGVYTAADVAFDAVQFVSGIGPTRAGRLVAWREAHERTFRFDAAAAVPAQKLLALASRFAGDQTRLVTALEDGAAELRRRHERTKTCAEERMHSLAGLEAHATTLMKKG